MNFHNKYAFYVKQLQLAIEQFLPETQEPWSECGIPAKLCEAMRYSLLSGGKRLRPVMLLASCEAFGENLEDALPFALALEMIHCYSLIHDDLPAMDNDDYRRGKPSSHKAFGEAMAILAGDALLNQAFELMSQSKHKNAVQAIHYIAKSAGSSGMIAGQVADILLTEKEADEKLLLYIQKRKTACLFAAALCTGAILASAGAAACSHCEAFALHFGLAFQIMDDILDVEGNAELLGKSTGKDSKSAKLTWPSLVGLDNAKKLVNEHMDKALRLCEEFGSNAVFFEELCKSMINRSV